MPNSPNKKILFFVFAALLVAGIFYYTSHKTSENAGWQTFSDSRISFRYPEKLSAEYIRPVDWPPKIQIIEGPFACLDADEETAPKETRGETKELLIGGRTYCVTKVTEGAAGSIYTQYAYAFATNGKTAILTFSLQSVQCGNYEEPKKSACIEERSTFDIDFIADKMARSLKLK